MDECKIVELIRTTLKRQGTGVKKSPVRIVTQYWTKQGVLVFEFDGLENPEPMNVML